MCWCVIFAPSGSAKTTLATRSGCTDTSRPKPERRGLRHVTERVRAEPEQPHRLAHRAGRGTRDAASPASGSSIAPFCSTHGRDGEEEGGEERERCGERVHALLLSAIASPLCIAPNERQEAVDLFNHVWTLIELPERTPEQDDEMIHAAHASRHHWAAVGTGVNLARGEWQISRVYVTLGRGEPALFHAGRCLAYCEANADEIADWDCPSHTRRSPALT